MSELRCGPKLGDFVWLSLMLPSCIPSAYLATLPPPHPPPPLNPLPPYSAPLPPPPVVGFASSDMSLCVHHFHLLPSNIQFQSCSCLSAIFTLSYHTPFSFMSLRVHSFHTHLTPFSHVSRCSSYTPFTRSHLTPFSHVSRCSSYTPFTRSHLTPFSHVSRCSSYTPFTRSHLTPFSHVDVRLIPLSHAPISHPSVMSMFVLYPFHTLPSHTLQSCRCSSYTPFTP